MNAIEISNVNYTYSKGTPFEKTALSNASVNFKSGLITGLMGHTGSGKSTLVRLFNGLDKPDSGTVKVFGEDIWANPKEIKKFRFKVGLVFQYPEYQLFEETVYDDIAYGPKNIKLGDNEIKKRVLDAARVCHIDESILNKSPFDLSGGQKRRVAIAGIMAMQPEILVLDEPAAGLDPVGREEIFEGIRNYRDINNATVIIVSHSMEDMAKYSDEIVLMNDASVIACGAKNEIFKKSDLLCKIGLDVPPITYLANELCKLGVNIGDDCFSVEHAVEAISKFNK